VTREELERKVDELSAREDFVAALEELARCLPDEERELLGQVLLARADYEWALRERIDEPWWYRTVPLPDPSRGRRRP
jgi:Flp pilus assembly protein TadB